MTTLPSSKPLPCFRLLLQQIGAELREARERATLSLRELAKRLDLAPSTVSRWETGERAPAPATVARYLSEVGAPAEQVADLVELAQNPEGPQWLAVGMPEQRRQLAALLEIERTAIMITTVSPLLIPGLLQTGGYARTVITAGATPASDIDTRVAVRLGRCDAITRPDPVALRALIGESVLHQSLGGQQVMLDQLRMLLQLAELSNIEVRVIRTDSDWHPGLEGPFSWAQFTDRGPVVHLENRISGLFLHAPDEVKRYEEAVDKVADVAMSPAETHRLVADVINGKETT
jgi:transcriptional regulator with XRE-family HTH domain